MKKRNQDVFEIEFEMAFYTHTHTLRKKMDLLGTIKVVVIVVFMVTFRPCFYLLISFFLTVFLSLFLFNHNLPFVILS